MIEGLHNLRDTGGLPLAAGGVTNTGVLYRSEALSGLTEAGRMAFAALPIGTIVDLRTETERAVAPDVLPPGREYRIVHLSVLEGAATGLARGPMDPDAADAVADVLRHMPTLGDMYVGMLRHSADAFAQIARLLATGDDALLVHCAAGKDRTGVSVALLLDAVGTRRDAVVADYAQTAANLAGAWATRTLDGLRRTGVPVTERLTELTTLSPPAAIEKALVWVEAAHGSSAGYLHSGGLTEAELSALRTRLAG